MNIKPIKTEADYQFALARVSELMDAEMNTPEGDELDILATLIESYEAKHYAIAPPEPIEAIKFRMEQMGLEYRDLLAQIKASRNIVTNNINEEYHKMSINDKPLVWLSGEIKTPPFSPNARLEAGFLLRKLPKGEMLSLPQSRPMPSIGFRCHELRINDENTSWRIIYRIDSDAVIILDIFEKKTQRTPKQVIETCMQRLTTYESSG